LTSPKGGRKFKNMKKYIRKVTRSGKRSLFINIPAEIVDELKIRERQKLVVKRSGKKIIIEDWKK
jgi:bifunctional DNA-binding transcriptional regulator/antitoxin component of YhaV-PrlF toxin-antitoxin module